MASKSNRPVASRSRRLAVEASRAPEECCRPTSHKAIAHAARAFCYPFEVLWKINVHFASKQRRLALSGKTPSSCAAHPTQGGYDLVSSCVLSRTAMVVRPSREVRWHPGVDAIEVALHAVSDSAFAALAAGLDELFAGPQDIFSANGA